MKTAKLTPDRVQDCINFAQISTEMTLEEYVSFFENNLVYCGNLIRDFFSLPKTELHKLFREKISLPHRTLTIKKEETLIQEEIAENSKAAQSDFRFIGETFDDRKYKLINEFHTSDGDVLVIGIPYSILEPGRGYITKFAFSMNIQSKTSPNLFAKLKDNLPRYDKS